MVFYSPLNPMAGCFIFLYVLLGSAIGAHHSRLSNDWRVVGGEPAAEGSFPWQVSLQGFGKHSCGGFIVHQEWIVTAAHCVAGASLKLVKVVVGTNSISQGGDTYNVSELHVHEGHDFRRKHNDIAMLRVGPIIFKPKVKAVLVESEDVGDRVACTLSGWGRTSLPGPFPDKLQTINLTTITVEECRRKQGSNIVETQICTYTRKGEGSCHGDSGGPLVRFVHGVPRVIGIVSWSRPCAVGYPDVFTRMSSYFSWCNSKCNDCLLK